jgi:aspartyl-tRNA(Asn)/glutamyl-tRNA(Gln) amidotransferase subunit C
MPYPIAREKEMKLSRQQIQHMALLARVGLSESELETLETQLSNTLENFEILQQVDTTDVPPTAQTLPLVNVYRADTPSDSYSKDEMLRNAPSSDGDNLKVRAVLEE